MTKKSNSSTASKNVFAESILKIATTFSLSHVFDDFLTMTIAACTQDPIKGCSFYEDEYLQVIDKYKESEVRHQFPIAFSQLIQQMEERGLISGNDVLGDFYEQHISNGRNGQYFTPFPVCRFIASITQSDASSNENVERLRIIDPTCGSGRMLLASASTVGKGHHFYGIDIDLTCVKMTALNLFLNGIFDSEVMCANALSPTDFTIAYRISYLPFGIFKILQKEQSELWQRHTEVFIKDKHTDQHNLKSFIIPPSGNGSQLDLF